MRVPCHGITIRQPSKTRKFMFAVRVDGNFWGLSLHPLKAGNLDPVAGKLTLTQTKTSKTREVSMYPALVMLLSDAALPTDGYLFSSPRTAEHLTRQAVDQTLRPVCAALVLKGVGTHSVRCSLPTNQHG